MQDGRYEIYVIQFRTTHKSPWLKPKGALKPVTDRDWGSCGPDYWGVAMDPHSGGPSDFKHKYPKSSDQLFDVRNKTGYSGWFEVKHAIAAVKRLNKLDAKGKFDSFDGYKNCQAIRHEFRIIRILLSQKTEILDAAGIIAGL
jgi:hypothetical protein